MCTAPLRGLCLTILCLMIWTAAWSGQAPAPGDTPRPPHLAVHAASSLASFSFGTGEGDSGGGATLVPDGFSATLNYSVPIETPVGRRNIQPNLRLLYRSGNPDGWLGVGWDLELGRIERMGRTGLDYAGADYQLITASGRSDLFHLPGGEYRLKIESLFLRIRQITAADNRPCWEVTDKTGTKYLYGQTSAGRVDDPANPDNIFSWEVERIQDTNGNYLTVSYRKDQGQIYPQEIDYTGNGSLAPDKAVLFRLEPRPLPVTMNTPGFPQTTALRLEAIDVKGNQQLVRRYELQYHDAAGHEDSLLTARPLIRQIRQVGSDGASSQTVLQATYQDPPMKWTNDKWLVDPGPGAQPVPPPNPGAPPQPPISPFRPGLPLGESCTAGDFDGDGRTDFLCFTGTSSWVALIATGSKFKKLQWDGGPVPKTPIGDQCTAGDFNGDYKMDIACFVGGQWQVALSTGTGFQTTNWGTEPKPIGSIVAQCTSGDFNGDGKSDIACFVGEGEWKVAISNGTTGFDVISFGKDFVLSDPLIEQCVAGDFNADGKTDLACHEGIAGDRWTVALSTGTGWKSSTWQHGPAVRAPILERCVVGDFNGDSRFDVACKKDDSTTWQVATSTGSAWRTTDWLNGPAPPRAIGFDCTVGDVNGDGRTDLACDQPDKPGQWTFYLSTGSKWNVVTATGGPEALLGLGQTCTQGDFYGSGKRSLACINLSDGNWSVAQPPMEFTDLLSSLTTRFGGVVKVTYQSSIQAKGKHLPFILPLLATIETNDGRGTLARSSIDYQDGAFYLPERDFRGFRVARVSGPAGGAGEQSIEETVFHQGNEIAPNETTPDGPVGFMKGKPANIRVFDPQGRIFKEIITTYAKADGPPYFNPPETVRTIVSDGKCGSVSCGPEITTKFVYDQYGNVVRQEDLGFGRPEEGRLMARSFQANESDWIVGLPASETVFDRSSAQLRLAETDFYYDGVTNCGEITFNQMPTRGNLVRTSRWNSTGNDPDVRMAFDEFGNVTCTQDARGNTVEVAYDSTATFPTKVVEGSLMAVMAHPHMVLTKFYGVDGVAADTGLFGQIKSVADANGATTSYQYDPLGRKVQTQAPDMTLVQSSYLDFGQPGQQRSVEKTPTGLVSVVYFDGLGREYRKQNSATQGRMANVSTEFDARGAVRQRSLPYLDGEPPRWIAFDYDVVGRTVAARNPDGSTRMSCFDRQVTVDITENRHRVRSETDAFGRTIRTEQYYGIYESCDTARIAAESQADRDLRQALFPDRPIPAGRSPYSWATYQYDGVGNLIAMLDSQGNTVRKKFDSLGRNSVVDDPNSGRRLNEYDLNGNLVRTTDARNQQIFLQYDKLNRLVQKDYLTQKPLGKGDVRYQYDAPRSFGIGRLTGVADLSGSTEFFHDALGRILRTVKTVDGKSYSVGILYDGSGRPIRVDYPAGASAFYSYDGPEISAVTIGSAAVAQFGDYDSFGHPRKVIYGNGVQSEYRYASQSPPAAGDLPCVAENARLCGIRIADRNGSALQEMQYQYDAAGNIVGMRRGAELRAYAYDDLNRLTGAGIVLDPSSHGMILSVPVTSGSEEEFVLARAATTRLVDWTSLYTYDSHGNLTHSDVGDLTYTTGGPGVPGPYRVRQASGASYQYDGNGNITSTGDRGLTYNVENRLVRIQKGGNVTEFTYDGDGARVKTTANGRTSVEIGRLYECSDSNCVKSIYAGEMKIALISGSNTIYVHGDHLGSPTLFTTATGTVVEEVDYRPFGSPVIKAGKGVPTERLFTDHSWDADSGLYYCGSRYYDPTLGRYLTPDTIYPAPFDPQGLNRYSYVLNSPMRYIDRTGNIFGIDDLIVGVLIGAAAGAAINGVIAAISGDNVLEAMLSGAVGGAILGPVGVGAAAASSSLGWAAGLAVGVAGGTAAGAASAAVVHGDVGRGALFGAAMGALTGAIGARVGNIKSGGNRMDLVSLFGDSSKDPGISFLNQVFNDGIKGAAIGATLAGISHRDIGDGALYGALFFAAGSQAQNLLGHLVASIARGGTGPNPQFVDGAFRYNTDNPNEAPWGFTVGNVVLGNDLDTNADLWAHELGHAIQYRVLGPTFLLTYGLQMPIGGIWGAINGQNFWTSLVTVNLNESFFLGSGVKTSPQLRGIK
jgi:RHS repeat-associated protein